MRFSPCKWQSINYTINKPLYTSSTQIMVAFPQTNNFNLLLNKHYETVRSFPCQIRGMFSLYMFIFGALRNTLFFYCPQCGRAKSYGHLKLFCVCISWFHSICIQENVVRLIQLLALWYFYMKFKSIEFCIDA